MSSKTKSCQISFSSKHIYYKLSSTFDFHEFFSLAKEGFSLKSFWETVFLPVPFIRKPNELLKSTFSNEVFMKPEIRSIIIKTFSQDKLHLATSFYDLIITDT